MSRLLHSEQPTPATQKHLRRFISLHRKDSLDLVSIFFTTQHQTRHTKIKLKPISPALEFSTSRSVRVAASYVIRCPQRGNGNNKTNRKKKQKNTTQTGQTIPVQHQNPLSANQPTNFPRRSILSFTPTPIPSQTSKIGSRQGILQF